MSLLGSPHVIRVTLVSSTRSGGKEPAAEAATLVSIKRPHLHCHQRRGRLQLPARAAGQVPSDGGERRVRRGRARRHRGSSRREADPRRAGAGLRRRRHRHGLGRVDFLLNGAGGNHQSATTKPELSFFDLPEDALRSVFELNMMRTDHPQPGVRPADGRAGRGRHPERLLDECSPAADARRRLLGGEGGRQQLHAVARRPPRAGVFSAHTRERRRPRLLPHGAEPLPLDGRRGQEG